MHPKIAALSCVGSTDVGWYIYRQGGANDKLVAAYTGGKNHMVVMPDADLESAAAAFVSAAYGSSSQRCMAVSLLIAVGEGTAAKPRSLVVPTIQALHVGASNDPRADFGAVITGDHTWSVETAPANVSAVAQGPVREGN